MMPHTRYLFPALIVGMLCSPSTAVQQTERIHSYHSDIQVLQDGSLKVTETITVTAMNRKIKRGIFRDFPTLYKSRYFTTIEVPFDVVAVRRDGRPEPYHVKPQSNGVRVYIGSEDVTLPKGQYTYEIIYTTNNQLGHFDAHDELYWNVTGNGWNFTIDRATASVRLPAGVPKGELKHEGYTGPAGSQGKHLESSVDPAAGTVEFATTRALAAREGLTIVVGFPKGHVREPTDAERRALFFKANRTLWFVLGGLFVLLAYYLAAWLAVGRDPPGDVIYPQFEPPLGLPPACVRFIYRMGYDRKCFTAAVLNMAVKNHAAIELEKDEYTLRRAETEPKAKLSPGEQAVYKTLLRSPSICFKQSNHSKIKKAIEKLGERLTSEYGGKLFLKNRWWLVPGWLLSAAALVAASLSCGWETLPLVGFMSIWLSGWTIGCAFLALLVYALWRDALSLRRATKNRLGTLAGAIFVTAFAVPFFIGEVVGIGMLVGGTSIWILPLLAGLLAINIVFWHLIKQRTVEGRRVMDGIEGFRMYLSTAEQEYLQRLHPPEETPELFEKYLPYALALDVENEWAEKFAEVLARAAAAAGNSDGYRPLWYHGGSWDGASPGAFASGLGSSLGNAIASSSTAPGSSSGFSGGGGGGGSSGGGGGGGGGGGW